MTVYGGTTCPPVTLTLFQRENGVSLTCHFQRALGGVRDGGGHAHRRVPPLLESPWMTKALRLFQFSSESRLFAEAWRLLPPLAGGFGLEAPRVVGAAAELVACFAVLAVPRESTFHQGALLGISAKLQKGRKKKCKRHREGRQSWSAVICGLGRSLLSLLHHHCIPGGSREGPTPNWIG